MTRYTRKIALLAAFSLVALLAVGAATASACDGPGAGKGGGGVSASSLVTAAAKQLNVTRAKLKSAIVDSANAYIDSEVTSGDVDEDAADLKDQVADDLAFAIATSRTKTVASNLGITVATLNEGFSAARKALIEAKIDKPLKDGDIDADQAAEAKAELDDASLPGYKVVGRGGGFDLGSYTDGSGSSKQSQQQQSQQQRRAFHR
jgi:hypothetical protein